MTVKEFLKGASEHASTFHLHKSKHHEKLSEVHAKLADCLSKADDSDESACHRALSEVHKAMANVEAERADDNRRMSALIDAMTESQPYQARKAAGADGLVPDRVMGVLPDRPMAVPRPGQREIPNAGGVSPQFEKFVRVDDDGDEEVPELT